MRTFTQQKAALTRAVNTGDKTKIRAEVARAVNEWDRGEVLNGTHSPMRPGVWPDAWHTWNIAFADTYPVFQAPDLRELIEPGGATEANERALLAALQTKYGDETP